MPHINWQTSTANPPAPCHSDGGPAGQPPAAASDRMAQDTKVSQGQTVRFEELEAIPWSNNGRDGVAYRAAAIHPAAQARAA